MVKSDCHHFCSFKQKWNNICVCSVCFFQPTSSIFSWWLILKMILMLHYIVNRWICKCIIANFPFGVLCGIDNVIFVVLHHIERAHDQPPYCNSTDAASRQQFSPRVAPTSGVCLSECLTDPQSSKGAEQVTAHSKMSSPLHNLGMYFLSGHTSYTLRPALKSSNRTKRSRH